MPPIALLWIALLQLLAPAGSMRPVSWPSQSGRATLPVAACPTPVVDVRGVVVGQPAGRCGEPRRNDPHRGMAGAGEGCGRGAVHGARGLPTPPAARSGSRLRTGMLTRSPGGAPPRALASALVPDSRAPMACAVATMADRTSRAVAARGRLLGYLPIPPPPLG